MKKSIIILSSLFLTLTMQAQNNSPQPKPGPAPSIKIGKPVTFELKNGLKVLVVENHKLPRVTFSLSLDNPPYAEGNKKGVSDLTSALLGNGTTKISKNAYNEEVDFLGASINFRSNGASASSLSKYAGRILELMADGVLNPLFTQEQFDKEKAKILEGLKADEKSVPAIADRLSDALSFGKNHPAGEFVTAESINNVTLEDVKNNFYTYFVPANAYLVVVGDVKVKETQKVVEKLFGNWTAASPLEASYSEPKNVSHTQINFVDMPNAVQSEVKAINLVNLKMSDPDYFATIVANQILGGDFNSYLNMNLREKHGWTYGAGSYIGADKFTSKFEASTKVRNAVTDSTVVEILKEMKRIRTEKVSEEVLNSVKAGYVGRFVMQIEKPATVAGYALRTRTQNLADDFYENYIKNISAVTADDILRVANKYFMADNLRILIVGKAADVLPGLEKLQLPIYYFDKFGNAAAKPSLAKPVPAGLTAQMVFSNYIKAVGGDKALAAIKSVWVKAEGKIQGAPMTYEKKATATGKISETISVMGQSMKQVFDGKKGYQMQGPQKKDMTEAQLATAKLLSAAFPELTLSKNAAYKVDRVEVINGNDAYVVKVNDKSLFYDVKSGLKVAESEETEVAPGKKMTIFTPFSDYKDVKGIKFPHKFSMNIGIEVEMTVTDVKCNEGVSDADFQ